MWIGGLGLGGIMVKAAAGVGGGRLRVVFWQHEALPQVWSKEFDASCNEELCMITRTLQ